MAGTHGNGHFYTSFPFIFFGLLLLAGILAFVLHKRWKGLPKIGERFYDPIVLFLGLWCLAGLLIDAFAHIAGNVDDTFFTPWHAVWYSGAAAYGAYIFYAILPESGIQQLIREPFRTLKNVETQHKAGVYGIIIFAVSGFGDLIWHETLGVEENTDILLSPTHIGLFIGLMMSVTAPLWSAWANPKSGKNGLPSQLLIVFGAGAAWCVALLMVRYANLWFSPLQNFCYSGNLDVCDNDDYNYALEQGLKSLFIQAALTSAILAMFLQRWKPARGTMFTLFMFHAIGVWVYSEFDSQNLTMGVTLAIVAEIVALGYNRIGPKVYIPLMAASQVIVFMAYGLMNVGDIAPTSYWIEGVNLHVIPFGWSIHSTIGSIVVCAAIGWFASIIAFPPQNAQKDEQN